MLTREGTEDRNDSLPASHAVDGVGSLDSVYARTAEINETLDVDSIEANAINTADLYASGTVDLGGATDTIAWIDEIAGDTLQAIIINGVITSITNY